MFSKSLVVILLAVASAAEYVRSTKRSIGSFGYPSWNSVLGNPWSIHSPYHLTPSIHGSLHHHLSTLYGGKLGQYGISSAPDVVSAVAAAKEAAAAAALAHQKVQAAQEQVIIQERVAAAKEAAAQAAIQRSEAAAHIAAAVQKSEALAAAAVAVRKSATASSAVSAHSAGSFTATPWLNSKPVLNHWR